MENIRRCPVSDFPLSVYILLILLLLLFLVHQFAGLCSKQKQMGNICPGDPGAPRSSLSVCPPAAVLPLGGSSPTVPRQAFLPGCSPQVLRTRPRSGWGRGCCTRLLRKQAVRTHSPAFRHARPALPACATVICKARKYYYW